MSQFQCSKAEFFLEGNENKTRRKEGEKDRQRENQNAKHLEYTYNKSERKVRRKSSWSVSQ